MLILIAGSLFPKEIAAAGHIKFEKGIPATENSCSGCYKQFLHVATFRMIISPSRKCFEYASNNSVNGTDSL